MTHVDTTVTGGSGHNPWSVKANNSGAFTTYWVIPYDDNAGETLKVTATGNSSGLIATTTFVDAVKTNLDQFQNGTSSMDPEWANGDINSQNSCYSEGRSVPFRYFITGLDSNKTYAFTIQCEWTKKKIHAYDYFTDFDRTEASKINSIGGTCSDTATMAPNDCQQISDSIPFKNPTLSANGDIVADTFAAGGVSVLQGPTFLKFYNATSVSMDTYYFTGTNADKELNIKIKFTTKSKKSVGFYWGGHLAKGPPGAPTGWDPDSGSGSISGAPFHMRAINFKMGGDDDDDDGGAKNQDRSIQPFPICSPPNFTIACDPGPYCPGSTHTCTADTGLDSYTWTVTGGMITSGQGTNSVTYKVTAACDDTVKVCLKACNGNNGCPDDTNCCTEKCVKIPVQDITEPTITCPQDKTVECGGDASPGATGTATATDNCGSPAVVSFKDSTISARCPIIIKRTWTATDSCGNSSSCVQTITVQDTTKPVITCPSNKVFDCVKGDTGVATATDNCGSPAISFKDSTISARCPIIIKRTWTATDSCGNSSSCVQTITVQDNIAPTVIAPADKDTFICKADTIKFTVCASDNCGEVKLEKTCGGGSFCNVSGPSPVCCTLKFFVDISGTYTFCFKATDTCGNMDLDTVVCKVKINSTPVATCPPNDTFTFLCAAETVCVGPFTCTDPDNNLASEQAFINGTPIPIVNDSVCFLPAAGKDSTYKITLICTDSCGKSDTCMTFVTVKFMNSPPVASCAQNKTVILCAPGSVCVKPFSCTDPDNNLASSVVIGGTLSGDSVCFTPVAGKDSTYKITLICTDSCGVADTCMTFVTVKFNDVPVIICPSNGFVTVCTLGAPICRPIMAYDPDGDSLCITKICGTGNFPPVCGDSQVTANFCFVPDSSGTYKFCFEAKEKNGCMKADTCEFTVTVKLDSFPPVVNAPDSTKRICQADTIRFTVCATDGDFGDSITLEKCSGNGTFPPKKGVSPVCQEYKFYADTCGTYRICFKATDRCGKVDYDTAVYKVEVHKNAPVVTAPDGNKSFCGPDTLKFQVCATDVDCTDSVKLEKISGSGTFCLKTSASPVCCTLKALIDTSGTYCFVFKATDECGKTDFDTACWVVTINKKPIIIAPDTVKFVLCDTGNQVCFNVSASGGNGDSVCVEKTFGPGNFTKVCGKPQAIGQFCWSPTFNDTSKCYSIIFKATDSCGIMAFDTVSLCILPPNDSDCAACIVTTIGEVIASPGAKVKVPITIKANTTNIGGFSLCIEYDPALLTFLNLERGEFFDQPGPFAGSYMWNYLVWRNNPSTVIHKFKLCIIGIGKLYYYGGICLPAGGQGVLYVEFRLSNNELYRCLRTPVIWERLDPQCIVNAFSDCSGNNVYVFDDTLFYNPRICDSTALWPKQSVDDCAKCMDGGVTFKCDVDPIVIGDINANGFAYEIGDAVLFANYFVNGLSVFSSDPEIRERQTASSDINRDGLTLSIADLVYLLRILAGDTQPLGGSKIAPFAQNADVLFDGQLVEINSPVDLGAVLMTFKGKATKLEPIITGVQVKWGVSEGETRVLVYGMNKGEKISAGTTELVKIYGDVKLAKVEAAEYYGIPVDVVIVTSFGKPESYLLSQNYPNPFNAGTTIRFATPIDGKVILKIYNVAGQLVREFSEFKNAGYHSITWDGNNSTGQKVSSGVYLYKLQVGEFTEIRKMTLLK